MGQPPEQFAHNSHIYFLDRKFPRIPVTASMLYTYAHMRGNNSPDCDYDPLHSALYLTPSRIFFTQPISLPRINGLQSLEEWVYWTVFCVQTWLI